MQLLQDDHSQIQLVPLPNFTFDQFKISNLVSYCNLNKNVYFELEKGLHWKILKEVINNC